MDDMVYASSDLRGPNLMKDSTIFSIEKHTADFSLQHAPLRGCFPDAVQADGGLLLPSAVPAPYKRMLCLHILPLRKKSNGWYTRKQKYCASQANLGFSLQEIILLFWWINDFN